VVTQSELRFGIGVLMVGTSRPEEGRVSPRPLAGASRISLSVCVADPDAPTAYAPRPPARA